ncbi:MAG: TIGR03619 family F420-dependent LLM class oxidoreductase [Hyphomonadaceae bacterium]|nr:TIGR03619 family F420-dependent LLM class oxidoreductase [Hyphomonadaceae bacterium]
MPTFSLGLFGLQQWFGGDFAGVVDLVRRADAKGVHQVSVTDHVVMGEALDTYPYGPFPTTSNFNWYEPITTLSVLAGATSRIRFSTGIIISPLRPAALLAKQIGTLDDLSKGRLSIGVGTGWQKEEYLACGVPWESRYDLMMEQAQAMRALWRDAPARFDGEFIKFEKTYCRPAPVKGSVPLLFGLAPSPKNVSRMAAHGDGWVPMQQDPKKLKEGMAEIRAEMRKVGRGDAPFGLRAVPRILLKDNAPDFETSMEQIPALIEAGATEIEVHPIAYLRGEQDWDGFLDRIVQLQETYK